MPQSQPKFFFDRLRTDPIQSTVPGSLPVLFFGDPWSSGIATIGINPSRKEYLSNDGRELDGTQRRFETLHSLAASTRRSLDEGQAKTAIERTRRYFDSNMPVYSWFDDLSHVVEGLGFSFHDRSAAHLDLVQEATDPVWSELIKTDRAQAEAVLRQDLLFLRRQIEQFAFNTLVCTSARVLREVSQMLGVRVKTSGTWARLRWTIGTAELPRGPIGIVGWNIPLKRPTGLTRDGPRQFGKLLASQMAKPECLCDRGFADFREPPSINTRASPRCSKTVVVLYSKRARTDHDGMNRRSRKPSKNQVEREFS